MHAYFPALTSWPSLLGDMLADAINCLGFTWVSCTYGILFTPTPTQINEYDCPDTMLACFITAYVY